MVSLRGCWVHRIADMAGHCSLSAATNFGTMLSFTYATGRQVHFHIRCKMYKLASCSTAVTTYAPRANTVCGLTIRLMSSTPDKDKEHLAAI
jgi:hypothetical protein